MTTRPDHLIERAAARMRSAPPQGDTAARPPPRPAPVQPPSAPADTAPFVSPANASRTHGSAAAVPVRTEGGAERNEDGTIGNGRGPAVPVPPGEVLHDAVASLPAIPAQPPELMLTMLERAGLVVGRSVRTRISEEFRIAVVRISRTSEQVAANGLRNPLILVTSSKPGEGKSFTALNMAAVMAQNGPRRAILADADFKRDSLTGLLGLADRRGLFDLLEPDVADPRKLLVTTEVPGLSLLPAGLIPKDELDAGFTRPLGKRIAALANAFPDDVVVLDAPPCLATSDPSTLAGLAGQVLLVVEAGRTQRAEVEAALDFVRACPVVTVLLNKVRQTSRQTFGSYDYLSNYQ